MAFPLGVIAYPSALAASDKRKPANSFGLSLKKADKATKKTAASEKSSPRKWKPSKKHHQSLSAKTLAANKRARAGSPPANTSKETLLTAIVSAESEAGSTPTAFELAETSPRGASTTRPKHIPIVVPQYEPIVREDTEARLGSFSTFCSSAGSDSLNTGDLAIFASRKPSDDSIVSKPRYVPIQIPSWAQPVVKRSSAPRVSLAHSAFLNPFLDVHELSSPDMSHPTPDTSRTSTMDSTTSVPSPDQLHPNLSNGNTRALADSVSANSSQTSLVGTRPEYESASEAESTQEEQGIGSHTPSQSAGPSPIAQTQTTPSGTNTSNRSGLVCNVHRTTGKEPHPLVGATTTILGDKLYVFGGRRLSRTKPQLTSNLYELDLTARHWTKLDVKGDIPPPRYFHSVCPLGDTKLVCYGGMSPAPATDPSPADAQPEVIVMSDIHMFDVTTNTWMKISTADSPQGRYAHCAAILPSAAVFASASAPMSAVHHNPPSENPNQGSLGISLDGTGGAEMVVVGGQDSANHYIEQVSVFNLRSLKWTGTTGMGRSCGAYRSVVTPLTSMSATQIGGGPHAQNDQDDDDDEPTTIGSGSPMLIYSNYNFLDVKLELQIRLTDGTLTEKLMQSGVSPPGLRFPNGGIIDKHFVVSGTFLTSSKQEYALWALDLRTLTWSRIDAGGSIFSQGSWNRGVLWSRRNCFVILGNRKRNLVDDYNNRRINFANVCLVELEAFGLYDNPRSTAPTSGYVSSSAPLAQPSMDTSASGRQISSTAEGLGTLAMGLREMCDLDFLAIDGTRIPVNSRLIARRWGPHFTQLWRESLNMAVETDTATLRPSVAGQSSRYSSITITPSVSSGATTLTNNTASTELPDQRTAPPISRPRLFYLPHTAPTLYALLHYLYTSNLPAAPSPLATPQIFCSLLQLARPYKIDGLLEAVVERLHESLDGRNAAAIFNAAAMAAGGGDGVQFVTTHPGHVRHGSDTPVRTASMIGSLDGTTGVNGAGRGLHNLHVDTEMANGRTTRNTLRPAQREPNAEAVSEDNEQSANEDEVPLSAATDGSMSENELTMSLSAASLSGRVDDRGVEAWSGTLSAVVGLQKRGLRGLMEGRRMRGGGGQVNGRVENVNGGERVGLGIA